MFFKDKKRDNVIICPKCGREYLPAEIFIPDNFFGHPEDIDRSEDGKIEAFDGTSMDLNEEYVCDNCGTTFSIETTIKFKTNEKIEDQFEEEYSSPLFPSKISLFEGDAELVDSI